MSGLGGPSSPPQQNPIFVYGTGSRYEEQDELVSQAIRLGYSIIDTGPSDMYNEELTALGIRKGLSATPSELHRNIHIQTKISAERRYEDKSMVPFRISDTPLEQVRKTFERSKLRFAGSGCAIKTLLLHAPLATIDLTMQFWEAMETVLSSDQDLEFLGICNTTLNTLQFLHLNATIKPRVVQNSFRAQTLFDTDVIAFCRTKNISYQAYGVLTSNIPLLESKLVGWFAETHGISEAEALFILLASHGMGTIQILHASHSESHMANDLDCLRLLSKVDGIIMRGFEELLAEVSATHRRSGSSWSY